jgi:RNA polymerase sigma factor (sigma-70 family)
MTPTDAELLRRYALERAEDAFAELVQRHLKLVYFAAWRRIGDRHLAEDVAQYVFTMLARDAATLSRHELLTGWLYTTTRFAAAKLLRSERRRRAREREAHLMHELSLPETQAVDWERVRPAVDAALDELGERDREAVLLRFFEGKPFAEIGAALRVTEDAARMRVERALDKLHGLLAQRGIMSTTSAALGLTLASQASGSVVPAGLAAAVTSKAIASGAVAGGMVLGKVVSFMTIMKPAGGVAAILLLIAGLGGGAYAVRARADAERALAAERANHAALMDDLRVAEEKTRDAERSLAELQRALQAARAANEARAAADTRGAALASRPDPAAEGDAFMARHPDVKVALGDYARARVNFRFGELYRKRGLTPAQITRFQELAAGGGMGSEGPEGRSMQLMWRSGLPRAEVNRQLREMLGDDGMRQYEELARLDHSRTTAVQVAGALWFSDTPLSPVQSDQFVAALERHRVRPDDRTRGAGRVEWDAVIAEARAFLFPAQLAVLEGERARDSYHEALNTPPTTDNANPTK